MYLDGTATTKPSKLAIDSFVDVCENHWGNPSSTNYELGIDAKRILELSRKIIARQINAAPEQIFFCSGATEAANWIISQNCYDVACSSIEHPAVYNTVPLWKFGVDHDGIVNMDELERLIKDNSPITVALMDSNNETGTIEPTKKVAEMVHSYKDCKLITDMTQSFAHSLNVDVQDLGMDFAFGSAHKFHGLKGVGFVYVKEPDSFRAMMSGGHQERGVRPGTENVAGIYSMAMQFQDSMKRRKTDYKIEQAIKDEFLLGLGNRGICYRVNGGENTLPSIVSITFPGVNAEKLMSFLAMDGIYVSAGSACSTGSKKPSRVLLNMGLSREDAMSTLRFSLSSELTPDDIEFLINSIDVNIKKGC